ncbi:mucin-17-like isoform X1 [Eriocheir sinensis]|uniref:mucin-17-like isoform X1 n=1 Tax=Eriocheir sinensis TaxID=95602 RepID=UPI0021C9DF96|nr:mucin-17-like isoform X1 [Eriocheir sinensis]
METGDHASWSSCTSSLAPCHGSVESLPSRNSMVGTPQPPRLPKDTMLDRVLRCLGAGQVAWTSDHLPQKTLQNLEGHCLEMQLSTDALQPDLFQRSFSLEEETFPVDKSGAVSSASVITPTSPPTLLPTSPTALSPNHLSNILSSSLPAPSSVLPSAPPCTLSSDQLTTLSSSSPSVLPSNSTPTPFHVSFSTPSCKPQGTDQVKQENPTEMIITPPKEFQEEGKSSGTSSPPDTLIPGSFRLITEQEYHRNIRGSKSLAQEVKSGGSGNIIPECSLTNLEHPARSAYLRLLLSQPPPEPPPPVPVSVKKSVISGTEEAVTRSNTPTSHYYHNPVSLEQHSSGQPVVSSTAGHIVFSTTMSTVPSVTTTTTTTTRESVRSSTLNKEDTKSSSGEAHEKETPGSLLSRRRHTGGGCLTSLHLNTLCSEGTHREVSIEVLGEDVGSEDVVSGDVSSNSASSSPPPVNFTTHPLTPDLQFSDSFTSGPLSSYPMAPDPIITATFASDTLLSDSQAVDPMPQDSHITTGDSHILSSTHEDLVPSLAPFANTRTARPHTPDSGSPKRLSFVSSITEFDKTTRMKKHSETQLSTIVPWYDDPRILSKRSDARPPLHKMYPDSDSDDSSNSSNSSSPREKNRVSLSSGKSEESLDLFINNPEPLVLHRVNLGRDGSVNPDGDKDSLISCQADVGDGWGVDAGPTIPQSLLNIGDEEFEQLVGKIVTEQPTSGSNLFSSVSHGVDADDMVKVTRSTSPTRKASFTSKGSSGTNKILPSAIKTHSVTTTIINKNNTMSSHKEHFITESTTKSPSPPGLSTTTISIITTTTSDTKHSVSAPKYTPISKDTSSAFTKNTFIRSFSGSSMEDPGTSEVHRHPNNFNEAPAPSGKVPTGTTSALFQPTTRIVSIVSKSSSDLSTDSPTTLEQAHAGIVAYPQSSSYSSEENPAIPKWSPILPEKNPLYIGNVSGSRRWSPVSPPKSKSQSSPEKSLVNPIWSPIHLPKTCFSPEKTVDNPKCAFSSTEKASNANSLGPNSPEKPSTIEDCPVLKNFDYYNNGQTFNKQASASPVKDPATSEIPSVATGSTVSSEKVPIAPRGYQILPENTSRIPPWVPVSPKKVSYDTQSGSPAKISTSGARGYRSAALKESSISNVIHPDIAKHMPIITKVFPPITTIARNYTSTPVTTTTTTITFPTTSTKKCTSTPIITATIAKTITSDKMFSDSAKIIPATPKFYTATTAYIPAVSTFCEDSTTEDDDQATNTTSTITTTALIGEEKVCTTSKNDFPTITASTFTLKDNLVTTNTTNTAPNADATVKDFLPRNVSKYVHGITSMSINITPSNKHDTPSMVTTTTSKDDDPATSLHTTPSSALYCASTKYIPAARSVPVPARYTVRSALHLPRASSQPDLSTSSSDHQSKMCRPGVPSPTSVSSVNIVPWRSTSLCGINSNPLTHHKEHGKGRLQLRHHSANAVHHLGFYSAKIDSQPKYEQDSSATSKRPQWAAIGSQTKGSPRAGGVVCYRSTVSLNPQTHSPSNNNLASQILPSASRGSANLSPDAEAAQSLHTQKRPQQSPTVCAQGSFTSSSGPVPCQFPRELKTFTSSLSPASPSLFPKGCHQGTTVVGTFNFQDRSEMPSLLASGEPLSSLSNGSQSGEEEGPTLLATFNFLGSPHPAPPMASRKAPAEGLSSLTDSFTSLEDGKHLLAVFDFTKPGTQRPPPPLALRPPPTNTQRPKVTTTKKSDHPHVQGRATTASQKSTLASPNKHVQSPRQKLASSSQQKSSFAHPKSPTAANSQKFASPHVPKSVPAAPQKSASFASAKHVPAAPQKSKFVSEQSGCPAKQSLSPSTLESQRARSSAQRNGSLPTTPCQFQPPTKQQTSTPTQPDMSPLHANSSTNRECDGRKVDMEGSSGTPYHIIDRETTPNDSERKGQESSHKKLATGCDSKAGNGEDLTRIDDHFLSVELLCMEDQRQREEEVEEESDHAVPLASVSKQSSLDSISQFVSRQFADWDACSPALSLIQSGEFWSTDRPFSPVAGASTHTPEGERVEPYGDGVASLHAHATPVAGRGRGGHLSNVAEAPQSIDPALLTSVDLESDHPHPEMLVTNAQQHHYSQRHHHDLNHNDHVFVHNSPGRTGNGSADKYMVRNHHHTGHVNYAFDSEASGKDYCYDAGYSSERSPEEGDQQLVFPVVGGEAEERKKEDEQEQISTCKLQLGRCYTKDDLMNMFPFISEGTVFEVTVIKNLRGLGLAVCGGIECQDPYAGLIRIKKLYPQTPAWLCGQLEVGDVLLHANGNPLTGLSSHEALEMLRTAEREVTLEMCRPPLGTLAIEEDTSDGGSGVVSTSLTLPGTSHNYLSPSPSFSSCGEFEVTLTKVGGSLGFTLRKQDNSILGHTIRTLVREPALSDGRIRPGDKIISVNDTNMCNLSHEEAISYLRTCPDTVTLKLYRDAMQTPVSPASPTEPDKVPKPKPLRKEARDMLTDLAMRKQSPGNSLHIGGTTSSPGTPRRRRLQKTPSPDIKSVVADRWDSLVRESDEDLLGGPTLEKKLSLNSIRETEHEGSPFGDSQTDDSASTTVRSRHSSAASSSCSFTPSTSESRPKRPSFLDLNTGRSCPRKTQFTPPHEIDQYFPSPNGTHYTNEDSQDSAPQLTSTHSDTPAFSHLHQAYHSVNLGAPHPHEDLTVASAASHQNLSGLDGDGPANQSLLKWKGIVFTPESEDDDSSSHYSPTGSSLSQKPELVTLELNRGWNSRLGFSLQQQGNQTIITAIYADSVAARDGRLKVGDVIVEVNNTSVVGWDSESVIDLLRKTRGRIFFKVQQQPC